MGKVFLALTALAMLTSCTGGYSNSLFSQSSYCSATGCVSAVTSAANASIYFALNNNTITKQASLLSGVLSGQQLEISGICNPGGSAANMITYSILNSSGIPFTTDIYNVPYVKSPQSLASLSNPACVTGPTTQSNCLRVGFCENGHFTLKVTPPADGANALSTCNSCTVNLGTSTPSTTKSFQVNVQIWTGATMQTLAAGPYFSGTILVQY